MSWKKHIIIIPLINCICAWLATIVSPSNKNINWRHTSETNLLNTLYEKGPPVRKKASSKKSKRSGNHQPSGFVCPTLISDELATFLNKPSGTEIARTSVSKEINEYIRNNSLQDKANGRQINADAKLATLLKLTTEDVLTYFNLLDKSTWSFR